MKQPLSYQTLPYSCWVTSVTNGLLCLYDDKNKIPGFVLRLLHSVLTDKGVGNDGPSKTDWEIVIKAVAEKCKFTVNNYKKYDVEKQLEKVDFTDSVVICDIGTGSHSILINGKDAEWYMGFDPDWDQVNTKTLAPGEYEIFPDLNQQLAGRVNIKVHKDYLFKKRIPKNGKFAMGAVSKRNITVFSKA